MQPQHQAPVSASAATQVDTSPLSALPPELLTAILSCLNAREILTIRRLSKTYNTFIAHNQSQLANFIISRHRARLATELRALDFRGIDILTAVRRYLKVCKSHLYPSFDDTDATHELQNFARLYALQNPDPWHKKRFSSQRRIAWNRYCLSDLLSPPALGGCGAQIMAKQLLIRMSATWREVSPEEMVPVAEVENLLAMMKIELGDGVVAGMLEEAAEEGRRNLMMQEHDGVHPVTNADTSVRICEVDSMLHAMWRYGRRDHHLRSLQAQFGEWKKKKVFEDVLELPVVVPLVEHVALIYGWPTDYSRREKKLRSWEILCEWYATGLVPGRMQVAVLLEDVSLGLRMSYE